LHRFQTGFSRLIGAGFANPDHVAADRSERLIIKDKFNDLPTLKLVTLSQSETVLRGIKDKARESLGMAIQIDDQAGAPLQHFTL
jgi:hypothetical protein